MSPTGKRVNRYSQTCTPTWSVPALFRTYFTEGKDLNDREQLVALASGVEPHAGEVRGYLCPL